MLRFKYLVVAISFTIALNGQTKKAITLEQAILKSKNTLAPKSKNDLKFIPNTLDYVYVASNYHSLIKGNSSESKEDTIVKMKALNALLEDKATLRHMMSMIWIDESTFMFNAQGHLFSYNYISEQLVEISNYDKSLSHKLLHEKSQNMAFTKGNNLGIIEPNSKAVMITLFDDPNIVAGQAIARSEFGITDGLFWNESGSAIAFYQKDETEVADYPLLNIKTTPGTLESIKYPMAGQNSEKASVGIYNLKSKKLIYVQSPIVEIDHYYTNLAWSKDGKFVIIAELNRDQDHMWLNMYEASTGIFIKTLREEKSKYWVEPEIPAYFINSTQFLWVSEEDGFMNLYLIDIENGKTKQITKNKFELESIIGHTETTLYFTGPGENPTENHAFSVNLKSKKVKQLTKESGYHKVNFSGDFSHFVDTYSSTSVPNVVSLKTEKGEILKELLRAKNPLENYAFSLPEISTIKAADGKTDLYTRMIKPSNFDPNKTYPVIVYVYGGPHAQMIRNNWLGGAAMWMYHQAEKGYILYTVDNRGSGRRGFDFEKVIHRNLGDVEMADQLEGVKFLKSLPYVDSHKMAVHGWSYGGFMTTSLMLRQPDVFKVGVAGGPVTDWSYYEIMYGERYMDQPKQNEEGYEKNRLMNHVKGLKGDLLLIHGTSDNVVVMQHNLALVKAFVDTGIQMDFFPYPMHPHNVRGKDRIHLMRKVLTYIEDNLEN